MIELGSLTDIFGSQLYFGSTIAQYAFFFITIIVFVIIAKIIYYIFKNYVSKITAKTKTRMDDIIIQLIQKPLIGGLFIAGLLVGMQFLTLTPEIASFASSVIGILITLLIMYVIIKVIDVVIRECIGTVASKSDTKLDDQLVPLLSKLAKFAVIALFLIIILDNFGYDVTALIAGLGVGGLAFAFAAKETISDAFGGFSIITSQPFKVGDAVNVENVSGVVEEIGVRHTRIRNWDKRLVTIPNSKVANSIIENIASAPLRKYMFSLGVTYNTPPKKLKKGMEIVKKIINLRDDCENDPSVTLSEFKDFSLNILVICFIKDTSRWRDIQGEINMKILEEF
ncbi:MAG: mechanosensitive ion channel family protein, partial [Nanoarchaeota archaeon]|nr:mechanosensitive ion channel family protein [Nanoarchaeota archaeon]